MFDSLGQNNKRNSLTFVVVTTRKDTERVVLMIENLD